VSKAESKPGQKPRRMRLMAFERVRRGALVGFARVQLPIGLTICDIPILIGPNGPFAALPSKVQLDQAQRPKRDPNGKVVYSPVAKWRDRTLSDAFSSRVIELVRAHDPDALNPSPERALRPRRQRRHQPELL
jgi:hypothetical protein